MLAENIHALRKKHKLSQQKFASILNVTQGTVSHWQMGIRRPSNEQLVSIASHFHVSLDDLVGDELFAAENTSEETQFAKFLHLFQKLPQDQKDHVQQYMRFVLQLDPKKEE